MEIPIPFGRSYLTAILPDHLTVDILKAPDVPAADDPAKEVGLALDNLLGDVSWSEFKDARLVSIAINDKTRPVPHGDLLPPLIKRLAELGIPDEAITIFIAVGSHQPMMPDDYSSILPIGIWDRYRVVSHNSGVQDQLIYLGETSRGTPVWSNKAFVHSEFKIVIGNLEPHQIAGFSGGVKTAAIGLAGIQTITHNHALLTHPDSRIGVFEKNPLRQDIEEIGRMIGVDLALNTVLNHQKTIVKVFAGEPHAVMQAGIPYSRQLSQVVVPGLYRLMIVSPGGHPKDINVYQAQKGLAHAALVTHPDGTVILAAACPEGSGSQHYEDWMVGKNSIKEVIHQFSREGFRIGPHKAYLVARDALRVNLMTYSEMDDKLSNRLLLNPVEDFQVAIDQALVILSPGERVGIMPYAVSTIPTVDL